MSTIQKLKQEEIKDYIDIVVNAYPGIMEQTDAFKENMEQVTIGIQENNPNVDFYGIFRDSKLVGGMRFHYLTMNLFNKMIQIGGVGQVAVDLLHKKEKVAKDMIEFFLQFYKNKKIPIVALYPFRPDFYKKLGFGYGTKKYEYSIEPLSFPNGRAKQHLQFIKEEEKQLLLDCINRYASKTHGMMEKTEREVNMWFSQPGNKVVGYKSDKGLEGYMVFTYKKASDKNFVFNDLVIKEFVYENREAFLELSTFVHTQADQFNRVHFTTQEEDFYFALADPRNETNHLIPVVFHESHKTGVGLMYRVVDVPEMFNQLSEHRFGSLNCKVKFTIDDNLIVGNNKSFVVHFIEGKAELQESDDFEVEIQMDISDFSSLLMNSVNLKSLYHYSLIKVSDERYVDMLTNAFSSSQKPVCMSTF